MKIIREIVKISLKGVDQAEIPSLVFRKIKEAKDRAENLAKILKFSEKSHRRETFGLYFWNCPLLDWQVQLPIVYNVKDMVLLAMEEQLPAKYTYIIDGEQDKNGMKISIDSTSEKK